MLLFLNKYYCWRGESADLIISKAGFFGYFSTELPESEDPANPVICCWPFLFASKKCVFFTQGANSLKISFAGIKLFLKVISRDTFLFKKYINPN